MFELKVKLQSPEVTPVDTRDTHDIYQRLVLLACIAKIIKNKMKLVATLIYTILTTQTLSFSRIFIDKLRWSLPIYFAKNSRKTQT